MRKPASFHPQTGQMFQPIPKTLAHRVASSFLIDGLPDLGMENTFPNDYRSLSQALLVGG